MGEPIRVVLLGTGQMGSGIARLLLRKGGLELVGVFARRAEREGMDLGNLLGLAPPLGLAIVNDLPALIQRTRPHIALQATCSTLDEAIGEITTLAEHGVSVISIAEEMAFPAAVSRSRAEALHRLALDSGVAILGTGVNPGFVLDLLIVLLSGVCADIRAIRAERVNDLSPFGRSVLETQGVGLTPEAFEKGVTDGSVVGHIGFPQSIAMIARAVGWEIERIEQRLEPIISEVRRETPLVTVEPGQVAGCLHTATAYRDGEPLITLLHPQQIEPHKAGVATGDRIEIDGTPPIALAGSPEIPGGAATTALAVNMIPRVLNAAPGLYSMADLPPPAALLDDLRNRLESHPIPQGSWVEIHRIVLPAGERAPQVPPETAAVPLEVRVKGHLTATAAMGDEAEIVTATGRHLRGTVVEENPPYRHGFGAPIPELANVGAEARALLRGEEAS